MLVISFVIYPVFSWGLGFHSLCWQVAIAILWFEPFDNYFSIDTHLSTASLFTAKISNHWFCPSLTFITKHLIAIFFRILIDRLDLWTIHQFAFINNHHKLSLSIVRGFRNAYPFWWPRQKCHRGLASSSSTKPRLGRLNLESATGQLAASIELSHL